MSRSRSLRMLGFVLLLGSAAGALAAPPRKVEIEYDLIYGGARIGAARVQLEWSGSNYRIVEQVRGRGAFALKGDITRTSQGAIAADGLRPRRFEDKRSGRDALHADFDPAAKAPTLKQQDQLSVAWTFAFAPPRKAVGVSVADGKRVSEYQVQPAGREKVKTPAGEFDAFKYVKKRQQPEDKETEIWIAADRQVPVRILIVDNDGTRLDQLASKISTQ
jgi:hypothetical protein